MEAILKAFKKCSLNLAPGDRVIVTHVNLIGEKTVLLPYVIDEPVEIDSVSLYSIKEGLGVSSGFAVVMGKSDE